MRKKYHFKTSQALLDHFVPQKEPVKDKEFEQACLDICEAMGLTIKRRPKADGSGMRVELWFGGEQGAVRCLCYRPDTIVQRVDISNFVKEYPEVDANHMIVMTTSTFSQGAIAYAQGTGIRIINGEQVFGLMKKQGIIQELPSRQVKKEEEPAIRDLNEQTQRKKPAAAVQQVEIVTTKSPLAARLAGQQKKQVSQGFDVRAYLRDGKEKVKPFR